MIVLILREGRVIGRSALTTSSQIDCAAILYKQSIAILDKYNCGLCRHCLHKQIKSRRFSEGYAETIELHLLSIY